MLNSAIALNILAVIGAIYLINTFSKALRETYILYILKRPLPKVQLQIEIESLIATHQFIQAQLERELHEAKQKNNELQTQLESVWTKIVSQI